MGVIAQGNSSAWGKGGASAVQGHINSMAMVNVVVMMLYEWCTVPATIFAKFPSRHFELSPLPAARRHFAHSRTLSPTFFIHLPPHLFISFSFSFPSLPFPLPCIHADAGLSYAHAGLPPPIVAVGTPTSFAMVFHWW